MSHPNRYDHSSHTQLLLFHLLMFALIAFNMSECWSVTYTCVCCIYNIINVFSNIVANTIPFSKHGPIEFISYNNYIQPIGFCHYLYKTLWNQSTLCGLIRSFVVLHIFPSRFNIITLSDDQIKEVNEEIIFLYTYRLVWRISVVIDLMACP